MKLRFNYAKDLMQVVDMVVIPVIDEDGKEFTILMSHEDATVALANKEHGIEITPNCNDRTH